MKLIWTLELNVSVEIFEEMIKTIEFYSRRSCRWDKAEVSCARWGGQELQLQALEAPEDPFEGSERIF